MKRINALTIAGTDPSGGAGIQADLKTFSALGAYGCSVITALVAQNTCGVQSVYRIEPDFVAAQLDSVFSDVRIDTTKIGMLAETDIVEAVAERLKRYQVQNVVLDTVMLAKSGDPLLSASAVETLRQRLLPQVSLITPNLPEAAALLDAPHARNEREMLEQGRALLALGCHLCRTCQTGKCNWGIATQRPDLVKRLNPDIGSQRLINLVTAWDHELKEMMGGMGINSIEALRGNRLMLRGIGLTDRELNILGIKHAGE